MISSTLGRFRSSGSSSVAPSTDVADPAFEKLRAGVAKTVARATAEDGVDQFLSELLHEVVECFDVQAVSFWTRDGGAYSRQMALRPGHALSTEPARTDTWSIDEDETHRFSVEPMGSRGYTNPLLDQTSGGVLKIMVGEGEQRIGVLVLIAESSKAWTDDEIELLVWLAPLVAETWLRLQAELALHRRVELEGFVNSLAPMSFQSSPDSSGTDVTVMLRGVVEFFDVAVAQIWQRIDGYPTLTHEYRTDGQALRIGRTSDWTVAESLLDKKWMATTVGAVKGSLSVSSEVDSRILMASFEDGDLVAGALAMVDHRDRWWTDDEISTFRAAAALISQVAKRAEIEARLSQTRRREQLIADVSTSLIDVPLAEIESVLAGALDRVRQELGFTSLALWRFDAASHSVLCQAEAADHATFRQSSFGSVSPANPHIALSRDDGRDRVWLLADIFEDTQGFDDALVFTEASDDTNVPMFLSAVDVTGELQFEVDDHTMRSLLALLIQVEARTIAERAAEQRAAGDRLIAGVAADFVERNLEDVSDGIRQGFQRLSDLCGCRLVAEWRATDAGIERSAVYQSKVDDSPFGELEILPFGHPFTQMCLSLEAPTVIEVSPGVGPPGAPDLATLVVAPIRIDGRFVRGLNIAFDKPAAQLPHLDIWIDIVGAFAQLLRQLWGRLEADRVIGERLAGEDLLRRFATGLLVSGSSVSEAETALGDLAHSFGINHASVWRTDVDAAAARADALYIYEVDDGPKIEQRFRSFRRPPDDADIAAFRVLDSGEQVIADSLGPLGIAAHVLKLEADDRVVLLREADTGGSAIFHMVVGAKNQRDLSDHVISLMKSALSILHQHHIRVVAEESFSTAFGTAPIGISLRSQDGALLSCNPAYCELVGRTLASLIGTQIDSVLSPEHSRRSSEMRDPIEPNEKFGELAFERPDGTVVWVAAVSTAVTLTGQPDPVVISYVRDITERRRSRRQLEWQATHDELTGLSNRRGFVIELQHELERDEPCAVLVLDLDRFKAVNDSLGHPAGDQLLITCADRIRLSIRPNDTVCRLGGDEFAVLLRSPADPSSAAVVAERLLLLLSGSVHLAGEDVFPSASIGIATSEDGESVEDLLRHADIAMYEAKAQGRGRSVRFDFSMREAVVRRVRSEAELRRAIESDQLEVHYQPELMLNTGRIVGAEALVRWRHPEHGLLSAGSFISLAEETGLIVEIGRFVLAEATKQAAKWIEHSDDFVIRVNLSVRQLRESAVLDVREALMAVNLPAHRLCLELTETAVMHDVRESAEILQQFRDLGVKIAIDDFGTGFSSLAYLKRLPFDILKIDRTFIDGIVDDAEDTAIVQSVLALANSLRLEVVAEGIEDAAQLAELVRLGCTRGQGFHLAMPAPANEVDELLDLRILELERVDVDTKSIRQPE